MKPISVIILNWNGAAMLRRFLPSVLRWSADVADVIVADNASTDGSLTLLRDEWQQVRVLSLDRNYGFAKGYNRAVDMVGTEFVLLLNSDVEVTEGYLLPLLGFMRAHEDVAAVQPKVLSERRRSFFEYAGAAGGYIDCLGYPYCRGRMFDTVEEDKGQYDDVAEVDWTTGAAMLVRTQAFKAAGGLDEAFFAHMEEVDLCWRLRNSGWRLACVPQSVVYHVGGGTLPKGNPQKTYLNFRNNLLMIYKNHPHPTAVLRLRRWLDALASLVFLLKGNYQDFKAVWRAHHAFKQSVSLNHPQPSSSNLHPQSSSSNLHPQSLSSNLHPQPSPVQSHPYLRKSILWAYYIKGIKTYSQFTNRPPKPTT